LGDAAADVIGAGLINAGVGIDLTAQDAAFVPQLIGVSLAQFGVEFGP
jgi:hypothetical protein